MEAKTIGTMEENNTYNGRALVEQKAGGFC